MVDTGNEGDSWQTRKRLKQIEEEDVDAFAQRFGRLKEVYGPVQAAMLREKRVAARTEAPDFNVFRILGVAHLEDNTHSPFLAELLNPQGAHGQGALFLRSFLAMLGEVSDGAFPLPELDAVEEGWLIDRELSVGNGYLDIVLGNEALGCLYVIENKIGAPEQPKQIKRYQNWLKRQGRYMYKAVIFLTPGGREPVSGSAFCLSYRQDVAGWLEAALDQIEAPRVRETVGQYVAMISGGWGKTMEYEEKVLEFVGRPENVMTALEIAAYVEKLRGKMHWQFWSLFRIRLDELYQASIYRNSWMLELIEKKKLAKAWAGCQLFDQTSIASGQKYKLLFAFQQFPLGNKDGLYYGIRWQHPENAPEGYVSQELDLLMKQLRAQLVGFYMPNWPAWVTLGFAVREDTFLIKMASDSEGFARGQAEDFWALFVANVEAVEAVNLAAVRIGAD